MSATPLRIAVVGHTNVGKTSLLRTLTWDAGFGEVASTPSTTREVSGARLWVDAEPVLDLFDTPGLEEPIALLALIEQLADVAAGRADGPARIVAFLAHPAAQQRFAQEAKVLRQLRDCDAGLLVIDVRDPVLSKHRDELALLAMCAVPLLPVLNFVRSADSREVDWREALRRSGLHAAVRFDTVAPEHDAEAQLYEALAVLRDAARAPLQRLLQSRRSEREQRRQAAREALAELLLDAAAARVEVDAAPAEALQAGRERLCSWLRAREQAYVERLLALYRFEGSHVDSRQLPLSDGRWATDLFHPEQLRQAGLRLGQGAAAGAAAGVGIDLLSAGITLGVAAGVGALLGSGVQAGRHFGRRWAQRWRGVRELSVDSALLALLAARGRALREALEGRGHAATAAVPGDEKVAFQWPGGSLPEPLRRAQGRPDWNRFADAQPSDQPAWQAARSALAELL